MNAPIVSVIVIAYKMRRQALNTIQSLSVTCQKNVSQSDYEIIVVENSSDECLDEAEVKSFGGNIHYYRRHEAGKSPAAAINFALSVAQGSTIGLLIDGARMVTPRVIENAISASRFGREFIMAVPGYFLGACEHQHAAQYGHTEETEIGILELLQWTENPYRLFDACTISAANPRGFFVPFLESNCFFSAKENFMAIGGANEEFQLPGGGSLNLYMYRKIALLAHCKYYFIAAGEGSFHQFHHGVTTSSNDNRESLLNAFSLELKSMWNDQNFIYLSREPILIGSITSYAQKIALLSARRARKRMKILSEKNELFWPDDIRFQRKTEQMP